jgi:hypothetical protein
MSLSPETSTWSDIEKLDALLDGVDLSVAVAKGKTAQLYQDGGAQVQEALAMQYYNFLTFMRTELGLIPTCPLEEVEQGEFLGAGATMTVYRGTWKSKAVAVK